VTLKVLLARDDNAEANANRSTASAVKAQSSYRWLSPDTEAAALTTMPKLTPIAPLLLPSKLEADINGYLRIRRLLL
jgi:hypothetical protein